VLTFGIALYYSVRQESWHKDRWTRLHQLDIPAMTPSFEQSRERRMGRVIDKITCTQIVQIDARRQNTLRNAECL
jgi:hypothetical protein